jgi:hypothetical protein
MCVMSFFVLYLLIIIYWIVLRTILAPLLFETCNVIGLLWNINWKKTYYFFLVGGCVRHLQNPATKCDLPIGYFIPLTTTRLVSRSFDPDLRCVTSTCGTCTLSRATIKTFPAIITCLSFIACFLGQRNKSLTNNFTAKMKYIHTHITHKMPLLIHL